MQQRGSPGTPPVPPLAPPSPPAPPAPMPGSLCASRQVRHKACRQGRMCKRCADEAGIPLTPPTMPLDDNDVDDDDEPDDKGAGEPHISFHSRQAWKSGWGTRPLARGEEKGARAKAWPGRPRPLRANQDHAPRRSVLRNSRRKSPVRFSSSVSTSRLRARQGSRTRGRIPCSSAASPPPPLPPRLPPVRPGMAHPPLALAWPSLPLPLRSPRAALNYSSAGRYWMKPLLLLLLLLVVLLRSPAGPRITLPLTPGHLEGPPSPGTPSGLGPGGFGYQWHPEPSAPSGRLEPAASPPFGLAQGLHLTVVRGHALLKAPKMGLDGGRNMQVLYLLCRL